MKRGVTRLFAVVAVLASACESRQAPLSADVDATGIDNVLRSAVERGKVAGVVAAATDRDGVVYEGAFGDRDVGAEAAMSMDSMFRIASMTKAVTSVAAMQLVEEGVIQLDAPVSSYIDDFAPKVLEGFDESTGAPRLRKPSTPVTVRHLFTHTAGFGYSIWNPLLMEASSDADLTGLAAPLVFEPGTAWHYGINTDWLGRVVEEVRGATLDDVFRERIFEPLGMVNTHYNVPAEKHGRVVTLHVRESDSTLVEQERRPPSVSTSFSGGGGLVSTAADYLRFVRMFLVDGELGGVRILEPESVALMAKNHIGSLEAGSMTAVLPAASSDAPSLSNDFDFFPDSVVRFGLGFLINSERVDGRRAAGSLAWAGLYNTYFWIDRDTGVGGVILTQILPFFDAEAVELLGAFERAVYDAYPMEGR